MVVLFFMFFQAAIPFKTAKMNSLSIAVLLLVCIVAYTEATPSKPFKTKCKGKTCSAALKGFYWHDDVKPGYLDSLPFAKGACKLYHACLVSALTYSLGSPKLVLSG